MKTIKFKILNKKEESDVLDEHLVMLKMESIIYSMTSGELQTLLKNKKSKLSVYSRKEKALHQIRVISYLIALQRKDMHEK